MKKKKGLRSLNNILKVVQVSIRQRQNPGAHFLGEFPFYKGYPLNTTEEFSLGSISNAVGKKDNIASCRWLKEQETNYSSCLLFAD